MQIKANVLLFVPLGMLLNKKALIIAPVISLFIEILQLLMCRGVFDVDDIISNSIGAVIGFVIIWFCAKLRN